MYCLLLVISDSALLPSSATGGGRKATNRTICFYLFWFCNQNKRRSLIAATLNCANSYNATLGYNSFLNIANYLHELKNMNIKIMDSRNKICCPICFLYIYSYFLFLINQYIKPSATRKPPRTQRKMILSVPSNIG